MVAGVRFPSVEMTESRLQAMAAARSILDSLPYKGLDASGGLEALKNASALSPFDHNKNDVTKDQVSRISHLQSAVGGVSSASQFQPFTAPWLAEVARIAPTARAAEHLSPFVHPPNPASHSTSLSDYYSHFSNLPPRSSYYNHPMFTSSHPYLRDYNQRPNVRPYHLHDLRHGGGADMLPNLNTRSPLNPSHGIHMVRPLGPPPPPPPATHVPDLRTDSGEETIDPGNPHNGPALKRRNTGQSMGRNCNKYNETLSARDSSDRRTHPAKEKHSRLSRKSQSPDLNTRKTQNEQEECSSSYYPHFKKGALVAIGDKVKRVEEMMTEDFIEAADDADDLTLDPPSVSSIVMASTGDTATVVFNFLSRKEEVS